MFEFKGDWETKIELTVFALLNKPDFYWNREEAEDQHFNLEIYDSYNEDPDPEECQMNTINYLSDETNQRSILQAILDYSKNEIYPHFKKHIWEEEYPECYPKIETIEDLRELYGIELITVMGVAKDNYAYYFMQCRTCLDDHGLAFTLYKDKILDWGEDYNSEKINEFGVDSADEHSKSRNQIDEIELKLQEPLPKYGKFKPWQADWNNSYPFRLFKEKQYEARLMAEIESGKIKKDPYCTRLLEQAIIYERDTLIDFFISQKPEGLFQSFMYALKKDRYDLMDRLIEIGFDLNEKVAQDSPLFDTIDKLSQALNKNENTEHLEKRMVYLISKGLDPFFEDDYRRNAFFRIKTIYNEEEKTQLEEFVKKVLNIDDLKIF